MWSNPEPHARRCLTASRESDRANTPAAPAPRPARAQAGTIRYAKPDGSTSGECLSWANACTLSRALTVAQPGDEIWVQAGVHYPDTTGLPNPRTATFNLKSGVSLYGGFSGTETSRDQRDPQTNITILSGDIGQPNVSSDNAHHVITANNITAATLDGFTITAGQAEDVYGMGGGLYAQSSVLDLAMVIFSKNAAYVGGGAWAQQSTLNLRDVIFAENRASFAGGGLVTGGYIGPTMINLTTAGGGGPQSRQIGQSNTITLTNVSFSSNSARFGGGMYNYQTNSVLVNVTFANNSAEVTGGGMYNNQSSPTLINASFANNSAQYGGGMYNYQSSPKLTNVSFANNSAQYGGGMYNSGSSPSIVNTIMWGDTNDEIVNTGNSAPTISYSDIQGCGGSGNWNSACGNNGGGNIDQDPLFVDPESGDLRLKPTSPCIDAGNNAAVPPGIITDLDGNPRFVDGNLNGTATVDMGAYEFQLRKLFLPLVMRNFPS